MRMNFGPINQSGGEKRLNVAFSRAKHHMAVVGSIHHTDITNDYNDGANCLKSYLQYAAACSMGDVAASQRVLREMAVWQDLSSQESPVRTPPSRKSPMRFGQRGYSADLGVGMSHFRCDIAARRHGENRYRLGVLVDTEAHYRQDDLLEREMMRPQLLRTFGWTIVHVLLRDWYTDRQGVLERLVQVIENGRDEPQPEPEEDSGEDPWAELDGPEEPETPAPPPGQAQPSATQGGQIPAAPPVPPAFPAGPFKRYFEFVGGNSSKFWEIDLAGNQITVRFGRIGANGQSQTKVFADPALATKTAQGLIREKLGKGYVEKPLPK